MGKHWTSYIGMIPSEHSSGRRQRLGAMSKQGKALLRYLWCEAAMHAVKRDPEGFRAAFVVSLYRHRDIWSPPLSTGTARFCELNPALL